MLPSSNQVMIKTEELTKHFDDFVAVQDINLEIQAGQVLALLGPNGAGKTTTVRMLSSILVPTFGRAWVAGYDVVKQAAQVRASVGVLTENHGLYNRMHAHEYLDFFGEVYRLDAQTRQERIRNLLGIFDLADIKKRRIGEFSKGMRQKLALARAMLHEPPTLLLDEPTSAMDPESARLVRDSIHELRSAERAIIICTHNLAEAEELADMIAIIRHGKIVASGSPAELRQRYMGSPVYEVSFVGDFSIDLTDFPPDVQVLEQNERHLRFLSSSPEEDNHRVLRSLLVAGVQVTGLREIPRSLEQVYLQIMQNNNHGAGNV